LINEEKMDRSVAIVGAGNVGSTAAYAIFLQNIAEKISLINIRHGEKAKGEVLDLVHGAPFLHRASLLFGSDLSMCEDAEVIVLCIGEKSLLNSKTNPNQSRLGLTDINAKLFREIIPRIVSHNRDAVYLVVTNPVDVLTYLTLKLSGLPWQRVIGTGTSLDSARFKYYLGEKMGVCSPECLDFIYFR
jgi:L-lactate dehydrogenase